MVDISDKTINGVVKDIGFGIDNKQQSVRCPRASDGVKKKSLKIKIMVTIVLCKN